MSFEESIDLLQDALKMWATAGENPNERQYLDFVSLVNLAIKKADEPFAIGHSMLAQVHFDMDNFEGAWHEAEIALSIDPNDFKSQLLKAIISFAIYAEVVDQSRANRSGLFGAVRDLTKARGISGMSSSFQAGHKIGTALGSIFAPGQASKRFHEEYEKLASIYRKLCSTGIAAYDFIDFSPRLIKLMDGINESRLKIDRSLNLYSLVAQAQTDHIIYDNEDHKEQIKNIKRIAEGRMTL